MQFWEYLLLFLSVVMGGGLAFGLRRFRPDYLQLVLSFSGAYILSITALHLLPSIYRDQDAVIGIWLLAGFFLQLMLEQLSRGVEHGHVHVHQQAGRGFAVSLMIGLCLHAFLEGLPLSHYHALHPVHAADGNFLTHGNHLLYGIILHKLPAAFALVTLLLGSGFRPTVVFGLLLIFASMSPLAAQLAALSEWGARYLIYIVAVVIGSFLHISTTILFEADDKRQHRISWRKLLAIALGLAIGLVTL